MRLAPEASNWLLLVRIMQCMFTWPSFGREHNSRLACATVRNLAWDETVCMLDQISHVYEQQ